MPQSRETKVNQSKQQPQYEAPQRLSQPMQEAEGQGDADYQAVSLPPGAIVRSDSD